ncbi:phosphotransferase enzyme family protein [Streptomyces europaeiscabiei]|uniref:Aminoglycoside phosphotransferase family protein n=1 Tax=Streptomyces europaeiscabiei TaxID=146819 RepID=A0ABU4NWM0_9ACTN|nr:aminoglycoside phosphotransferase family protein [Streptomyces europaeiscabiei]MDX3549678.1 aminoglycoside phosphotransferase family protein [Streptomyces europaeiscabiei]MDX3558965.1 aminoglycoside phosphotransferase family protein [Streptomyces europaeiscabiei]MDX3706995.1 aminoglycoside phosphotransferase family protein [Streptomyces europaeiscabiei]
MAGEEVMQDSDHRRVVRIGDTVRRPVQPWTPSVHALLRHLEEVGFAYAPRPLGVDGEGREVLTFIKGDSGAAGWAKVVDDQGLRHFARLLRDYHDACAGFSPPPDATWSAGAGSPGDHEVVCHGDFGPWNVVWQGDRPVGIIDWDFARPAPRLHDVAYALEYVAPFRDDAECLRWLRYPAPPDRRRRLEIFCNAYGLDSTAGIVSAVIGRQQDNAGLVHRLAEQGYEPQATWVADGLLAELDKRIAWSRAYRHLFE